MMVEVKVTPNLIRNVTVNNEKEMEKVFVDLLKKSGWVVKEQIYTTEKNRTDVLARHHSCSDYFIFELKYDTAIKDYTKAFKQIFDKYYKRTLTYNGVSTSIVALVTPNSLSHSGINEIAVMVIERFFWRMGFGIGSLEDFAVTFTSQGDDARINLAKPNDYRSLEEKVKLIKERQHWND